ncbi:GNAT family N-acetyltransferase [Roseomonas sp. 18066]|uniref:GNAT family N-acetyltransferase n=1 Tax=Roseomonas sp. 18066 TaxID=2681412 RepID=UPI00135AC8B5|nr:GNAT family N-acetyltransferase [Roseomonas sp. 18066]
MDGLSRVESPQTVRTSRLTLRPVGPAHLADLTALKGDEAAFGLMLNGIRPPEAVARELAEDQAFWARHGYGTWAVHLAGDDAFLGIVALSERPDGRGVALRFALWPHTRGRGYAREAARAAIDFGHGQARLPRIIAIAREDNLASRAVLEDLGLKAVEDFPRDGVRMLVYESRRAPG